MGNFLGEKVQVRALYLSRIDDNLGDMLSALFTYREFLNAEVSKHFNVLELDVFPDGDVRDFGQPESWKLDSYQMVFVGGGGLIGPPYFDAGWRALLDFEGPIVVWGAGSNVHFDRKPSESFNEFIFHKGKKLFIGTRDLGSQRYIPCPSVLNRVFDKASKQKAKFGIFAYWHMGQKHPRIFNHIPSIENDKANLDELLKAFSENSIVITNSYHGALWSRMIGRKVLVISKFSNKFHYMPKSHRTLRRKAHVGDASMPMLREISIQQAISLKNWLETQDD